MLTTAQEKLIRSLDSKKGRQESGRCLVEGSKSIAEAGDYLEYTFTPDDAKDFTKLVDTVTPQEIAGVARIPAHTTEEIAAESCIVVLDGVQDPGNVGTILRLCLGFGASLILIESADPSSPKVVRSSAGAFFKTPWMSIPRAGAEVVLKEYGREMYRLEKGKSGTSLLFNAASVAQLPEKIMIIAGSEGQGIKLELTGTSLEIPHDPRLESLNVASALSIILANIKNK